MSDTRGGLSGRVEAEIRAEMARQRISQIGLSVRVHQSQAWVSRRLSGVVPISLDDLELIAHALDVTSMDLVRRAYDGPRTPVPPGGESLPHLDSNQKPFG